VQRMSYQLIVTAACLLLAVSSVIVVCSSAVVPFVLAQLLQGIARPPSGPVAKPMSYEVRRGVAGCSGPACR
jgi:hypothetical protein